MVNSKYKGATKLTELDVREVSVVDRGANKKKFLIVKSFDGLIINKEMEGDLMPRKGIPAAVAHAQGLIGDDPDKINKDDDDNASFLDLLGVSADPGATESDGDDTDESEGSDDSEGGIIAIEKDVKATALKVVNALVQKLTAIVEKLKASIENKSEVSGDVSKELIAIAQGAAKLVSMLGGESEPEKSEKSDASSMLKKATSALEKLMDFAAKLKEADDGIEKVEGSLLSTLKQAASVLSSLLGEGKKETSKKNEVEETETVTAFVQKGGSIEDPEIIFKVGAKIKRSRLSKLKKLHDLLGSLIFELEGAQKNKDGDDGKNKDGDKGKGKEKKKPEIKKFEENLIVKIADKITPKLDSFTEKITGTIDKLSKRMDSLEIVRPAGNGGHEETEPVKKGQNLFHNLFSDL